jgi:hypothetical protein
MYAINNGNLFLVKDETAVSTEVQVSMSLQRGNPFHNDDGQ